MAKPDLFDTNNSPLPYVGGIRKKRALKKPKIYNIRKVQQEVAAADDLIVMPTKPTKAEKTNFAKAEEVLKNQNTDSLKLEDAPTFSSLPHEILSGKITSKLKESIQQKYSGRNLPVFTKRSDLRRAVLPHLALIPRLLAGEEEFSFYFNLAVEQRKILNCDTMSEQERWQIEWQKHTAGFHGLRRQAYVSQLIQDHHGTTLARSKNSTVLYWTPEMFCTYVLANEMLLRAYMERTGVPLHEAEKVFRETADFGCHVADGVEFVDDEDTDPKDADRRDKTADDQ